MDSLTSAALTLKRNIVFLNAFCFVFCSYVLVIGDSDSNSTK